MSYFLSVDECEALGIDPTLRTSMTGTATQYSDLSEEAKVKFWAMRCTAAGLDSPQVEALASSLDHVAEGCMSLVMTWHELDLNSDFIVPELGLPVSMSVDEAGAEVNYLADLLRAASDEYLFYVGKHRGRSAA